MRMVDKRKWRCHNSQGKCILSQEMSSALCQEAPADKKCPLCHSDITIFGEEELVLTSGIVEIVPEWRCLTCGQSKTLAMGESAPTQCPTCGEKVLSPLVKKGGPFDPDKLKKY